MILELVIRLINLAFDIYYFLIIAEVILSWIPHNRYNPVFRFIHEMTEPFLGLFSRMFRIKSLPIDFSPIIALIVLSLIQALLFKIFALLL